MLVPTDKKGVCWHCHQPIAYFQPTQKSWIEANAIQRVRLSPRWLHTEEPQPYWNCKINGYHPGSSGQGVVMTQASPQSNLVRIVVVVGVIVALILALLIYSFATYEPLVI